MSCKNSQKIVLHCSFPTIHARSCWLSGIKMTSKLLVCDRSKQTYYQIIVEGRRRRRRLTSACPSSGRTRRLGIYAGSAKYSSPCLSTKVWAYSSPDRPKCACEIDLQASTQNRKRRLSWLHNFMLLWERATLVTEAAADDSALQRSYTLHLKARLSIRFRGS